ncbi:response regulator transcription factor [Gorillibacterium sp. CAU 1737]|uniref:response regulator transcription factor n=1 Tax=Gorillibacterium sp. CAU 1737 TaxID=3140362 RepID=UPI0032609C9C
MATYDCLIVDDEEALSQSTCKYFHMFGLKTHWAADEQACFDFLAQNKADLILLDINLGQQSSGFEICKRLRKTTNIPILFISARTSDDDVLLALTIGGDDYIQKPYALSILLAKVKAVLKRYRGDEEALRFGSFRLDLVTEKLMNDGSEIKLKAMEYKLLAYLIQNKNRPLPKEELFANVWKDAITTDGTLNVHIRKLREKIEEQPNEPRFIKTLWGTGYVFEAD